MTLRFSTTRVVDAPLDAVWRVLGDFGTEHRWTKTLLSCERDTPDVRVGTSRICTLPKPLMGRSKVRETLTEYEPGRALAYDLEGAAGPFARAASRWSVDALRDGRTEVRVEGVFEPRGWIARAIVWPLARPFLVRLTRGVVGELDAHLRGRA